MNLILTMQRLSTVFYHQPLTSLEMFFTKDEYSNLHLPLSYLPYRNYFKSSSNFLSANYLTSPDLRAPFTPFIDLEASIPRAPRYSVQPPCPLHILRRGRISYRDQSYLISHSLSNSNNSYLDRMSGPTVEIKIGSSSHVYEVSRGLLCEKSPYFAAMFEGKFVETTRNAVTLEKIEDIVSVRSFVMLLEWIYLDKINEDSAHSKQRISDLIELARFADMCMVSEKIFDLIQESLRWTIRRSGLDNIYSDHLKHVTKDHIDSAMCLPIGNPVRKLMVSACVKDFLGQATFRFAEETKSIDNFAADLLDTVRDILKDAFFANGKINYIDPLTDTRAILFPQDMSRYKRR